MQISYNEKNNRLPQLDGLRGLFAIIVVLSHYPFPNSFLLNNFVIKQGNLFVDYFFVLSGFVINLNYNKSITDYASFTTYLKKRFLRLFPLLFYSVLLYLIFETVVYWFKPGQTNFFTAFKQLLQLSADSLTFLNATPLLGNTNGMNYPSWSISAEMICYVIFGITVLFLPKKRNIVFCCISLLAILFIVIKKQYLFEGEWGFIRGVVCFFAGVFSFNFYKKNSNVHLNKYLEYCIPILLILIFYIRYTSSLLNDVAEYKAYFTLCLFPVFYGFSIIIFSLSKGLLVKTLSNSIFAFTGKISYSIYLNHALVLLVLSKLFFWVLKIPQNEITIAIVLIISVACVIIYSFFTFNFVEKNGKLAMIKILKNIKILFDRMYKKNWVKNSRFYKQQ